MGEGTHTANEVTKGCFFRRFSKKLNNQFKGDICQSIEYRRLDKAR
jgi:hypothetical protein